MTVGAGGEEGGRRKRFYSDPDPFEIQTCQIIYAIKSSFYWSSSSYTVLSGLLLAPLGGFSLLFSPNSIHLLLQRTDRIGP